VSCIHHTCVTHVWGLIRINMYMNIYPKTSLSEMYMYMYIYTQTQTSTFVFTVCVYLNRRATHVYIDTCIGIFLKHPRSHDTCITHGCVIHVSFIHHTSIQIYTHMHDTCTCRTCIQIYTHMHVFKYTHARHVQVSYTSHACVFSNIEYTYIYIYIYI